MKQILKDAIEQLTHDIKLIRLAFITSCSHTLIVIFLLAWNINNLLQARFESGLKVGDVAEVVINRMQTNNTTTIIIIVIIFLIIGYGILYPIGQAALVHHLHDKRYSVSTALGKGINNFFPMFELNALVTTLSSLSFLFIILRLFMLDITSSIFIKIILIMRGLIIVVTGILRPYTKFGIIFENMSVMDAIRRSTGLAFRHLIITIKFVLIEAILIIRFFLNIIIVLGIPFLLVFFAVQLNIVGSNIVEAIIIITAVVLLLAVMYMNAIVDAFFATYRYKVYHHIINEEEKDDQQKSYVNTQG